MFSSYEVRKEEELKNKGNAQSVKEGKKIT